MFNITATHYFTNRNTKCLSSQKPANSEKL